MKDGVETVIPTYTQHLLCDDQGLYPAELNDWERKVLAAESKRPGFKFWYRNPNRPSQDSLGIAYTNGDVVKIVRPDFIFFCPRSRERCRGHRRSAQHSPRRRCSEIARLSALCRHASRCIPTCRSDRRSSRQAARAGYDPRRCPPSAYGCAECGCSLRERAG